MIGIQKIKYTILICIFLHLSGYAKVKHFIKLGTQIPFQYCGSYEMQFHKRFSASVGMGVILPPYDNAIIGIAKIAGLDKNIANLISDAFSFGFVMDTHGRYHFKKGYYTGLYLQSINLYANSTNISGINYEVKIESNLTQFGILFGKNWNLKNKRYMIGTEVSISQNISSSSAIRSPLFDLTGLDDAFSNYTRPYFDKYALVPSINIYWVIKLGELGE